MRPAFWGFARRNGVGAGRMEKGFINLFLSSTYTSFDTFFSLNCLRLSPRKEGKITIPSLRDVTMGNFRTLRPGTTTEREQRRERNFHFSGPFAVALRLRILPMMKLI
jgi:hypothetical protein